MPKRTRSCFNSAARRDHSRSSTTIGSQPEQLRISAQSSCRDASVAPVILGTGNTDAVTQTVKLLGINGVNRKATVVQSIDHRLMRHFDRDGHRGGIAP